jgi:hypothetical protein
MKRQRSKRYERWQPTLLSPCPICSEWVAGIKVHFETDHTSDEVAKWNQDTVRDALLYWDIPLLRVVDAREAQG